MFKDHHLLKMMFFVYKINLIFLHLLDTACYSKHYCCKIKVKRVLFMLPFPSFSLTKLYIFGTNLKAP